MDGHYLPVTLLSDLPILFHLILRTAHEVGSIFSLYFQSEKWAVSDKGKAHGLITFFVAVINHQCEEWRKL